MKKVQTLSASLLLIMAFSMTALADCPEGGIMGTGGVCTNGIMGTGAPTDEPAANKASATDVAESLLTVGLAVWQSVIA